MKPRIPGPLWIALVSLAIMVLVKVASAFTPPPVIPVSKGQYAGFMLLDAACSAALLAGLLLGHRWAYWVTLAFVVIGVCFGLRHGIANAALVFAMNCLVLVPVLQSTRFFFPHKARPFSIEPSLKP